MDQQEKELAEELLSAKDERISPANAFFLGKALSLTYPALDQDPSLLTSFESFLKDNVDGGWIDREGKVPEGVIRGLADLGILGMTIPKEYGGRGASQSLYCQVMERLAASCASTAILVNAHQSIGLRAILLYGTQAQKQRWLPPLARGEFLAAFSLTEPNAGSDAQGIETTALLENGFWHIHGRKQWTTNGSLAGLLTVMAKVQGKVTAFMVTPEMPGFCILEKAQEKVGIRGTWTTNLAFDDLIVPPDHVLGPVGEGLKICLTCLDYGRTTFGATCTGIAKDLLKRGVRQARSRIQFRKPIASFPLIQEKMAKLAAYTYAMEATTYLTASLIDEGKMDFMLESAILKVFASEALWELIYETMQIYGGRSFFTNEPLERIMRDARLNMIGEGANEVLRVFIGAVGFREMGKRFIGKIPFWQSLKDVNPFAQVRSPFVSRGFDVRLKKFKRAVLMLLFKYQEEIIDQQLLVDRIATCVIALYTAYATLLRLKHQEDPAGRVYLKFAWIDFDTAYRALRENFDEDLCDLADGLP